MYMPVFLNKLQNAITKILIINDVKRSNGKFRMSCRLQPELFVDSNERTIDEHQSWI